MADEISEICMMEEENKVNIEETAISWMKSEPKEVSDSEENDVKQFKITVEYENIFGETSHKRKFKEDDDNLISSINNDVTETTIVKLENVKQEEDATFNNFLCSNCNDNYKGFCLKCTTLFYVLNNTVPIANVKSESNAIPTDILEIRETYVGKGVFLLRTLPKNVLFGPFEGITGIESTVGYSWKICDKKLMNVENGNWMGDVFCAANALFKNLDIYQIDGNLYFQTNREIIEGEELLIYYNDEEIQKSDDSKECLYTPLKHEKLSEIFACTLCCLGFGTDECLMEHKMKCPRGEQSRSMEDFELVECHYCKMWLDKQEHEEYHIAYCSEKHDRMEHDNSEAVDPIKISVEEIDHLGTKNNKREYYCDMYLQTHDQRKLYIKDEHENESIEADQSFTQTKQENINEDARNTIDLKFKCSQCCYQTNYRRLLREHLNIHIGITQFQCDICLMQFTQKSYLTKHIKNKHTGDAGGKKYKCPECTYQTNHKSDIKKHSVIHTGVKPYHCDICMMKFTRKDSLMIHVKNRHGENGSGKVYKCSECFFQADTEQSLENHRREHVGTVPFQCAICMTKFANKYILKTHTRNKHAKEDKTAKIFKCLECTFETNYKTSFDIHFNTHRGIKRFECDICLIKFSDKGKLTRHKRNKHETDNILKDHKCSECAFETKYKSCFTRHLNIHTGIKLYECDICSMVYRQKSSLDAHMKNKHTEAGTPKDYKCAQCSYQTNHRNSLKIHLSRHNSTEPFQCDICTLKFSKRSGLKIHVKRKHV